MEARILCELVYRLVEYRGGAQRLGVRLGRWGSGSGRLLGLLLLLQRLLGPLVLDNLLGPAATGDNPRSALAMDGGGGDQHVLSARVELVGPGHVAVELGLGADLPAPAGDAKDQDHEEGRVALPIGGLGIPATGRRPDMLGVPGHSRIRTA